MCRATSHPADGLFGHLARSPGETHDSRALQPEPISYREEVTAILIGLGDINVKLSRIVQLLEDGDEEEEQEDDA